MDPPRESDLSERVSRILKREGVKIEPSALRHAVQKSNGDMRSVLYTLQFLAVSRFVNSHWIVQQLVVARKCPFHHADNRIRQLLHYLCVLCLAFLDHIFLLGWQYDI
jgi:DNA polymerase III delta prime subunit